MVRKRNYPITAETNTPASTYARLEQAYIWAYAQADKFDDLNRALVQHYVARSSRAAASFLRTRSTDPALAERADRFADSAAELDNLSTAARLGKYLYKLLPGGLVVAGGLAAITFFLAMLSNFNKSGEDIGAQLFGLALSGGLIIAVIRGAAYAAQGAAAASKFLGKALQDALESNREAKQILAALAAPENALFAPVPLPSQAKAGRFVVNVTGPILGAALAILVAIPVALGAATLAGIISGVDKGAKESGPFQNYTFPTYTAPDE